ncbi:MAG: AAA family ATPase [Myxococcales bacterium]|nr:AAA family ATPase [Myxococcales bacterium]
MIQSIRIQNYKTHVDTTVHLSPLTVLVGPNGAGKSAVLEALSVPWRVYVAARERAWFRDRGHSQGVRCGREFSELNVSLPGRSIRIMHRVTEGHWLEVTGDKRVNTPAGPSIVPEARVPQPVAVGTFAPSEILRLDPKRLREPSYSDELEPRLGPSGDGLATVLADLKLQHPARFETVVATLKQLVPSVRNVNLQRARVDRMTLLDPQVDELGRQTQLSIIDRLVGHELRFDMNSGTDLPASVVSEGTLHLLAILTAFYSASDQEGALILLDDIDHSLHPSAQRELITFIRELVESTPKLQVVATTHSPYLVDGLRPEEVVIVNTNAQGVAAAKRLSEHPEHARALSGLSTGELWSAEGESWLFD